MRNLKQNNSLPVFAMAVPALRGNNWLLTRDFAFIDLVFFSLLA
jgi:hypothetical protein